MPKIYTDRFVNVTSLTKTHLELESGQQYDQVIK